MKTRVLAIPLVFSSFVACAVPVDGGDPTAQGSDELIRGGVFNPGTVINFEPDYCAGATGSITAAPSALSFGGSTTLTWSVNVPAGCSNSVKINGETVASVGSKVVKPLSNDTYAVQLAGKTLAHTSVNVTLPSVVRIKGNTPEWRGLLVQAVGTPNTRVVLESNVDMDLSGYDSISVKQGVTLTSELPALYGELAMAKFAPDLMPTVLGRNAKTLGPRLYTNTRPKGLFHIACEHPAGVWGDNVKFSGFRLQGPHFETMEGDDNLERGIMITSCSGVDISTMELSGFSGQAIYIQDPLVRQIGPNDVRIHDNYIHHNQHEGGNGYGVAVNAGAWATIERNVFDFNRHAIKASGSIGTSYIADHNLVLAGGGVHNKWYNHYTHQFDVHGDANCDYGLPGETEGLLNCGNAGEYFEFTNNAFQFTNDHAIKLRGVPRVKAKISGNVFAHDSVGDAIAYEDTRVEVGSNTANVNPFGKYGVCDFDGDGVDDLFLATGTSWWFSSGGNHHWTYLNSHNERLDQVGLGDFDGDKRCDVFAVNRSTGGFELSKSGTSAWAPFGGSAPFEHLRFGDFNGDRVTDIFRRAPDGQWSVVSPGIYDWKTLGSSSIALADLRFGDFNGDGVTDVLKRNSVGLQVSLGGTTTWQPWNTYGGEVEQTLIADVDGFPGDDILRYVRDSAISGRWEVSSQGRNPFITFATLTYPNSDAMWAAAPASKLRSVVGRFDATSVKADLLTIDHYTRFGQIFSLGSTAFAPHSRYAY